MGFWKILWNFRSTLLLVLLPFILLPLPLVLDNEGEKVAACGYCIIIMSAYWISEVLPLPVTSFLPLILFPLMGIMTAKDVSLYYLKDISWIFIGGLTIAVAIEHTNLHKRLALSALLFVGSKPHSLMLGFMVPTYLLSMWITNTATTAMMIPIVSAVLGELKSDRQRSEQQAGQMIDDTPLAQVEKGEEDGKGTSFFKNEGIVESGEETENVAEATYEDVANQSNKSESEEHETEVSIEGHKGPSTKHDKGLTLCVPYAATIGGISTVTGTGPNLVLVGQYPELFPYADPPLTFGNWIAYHLPLSFTFLMLAYVWLMWLYLGLDLKTISAWLKRGDKTESEKKVTQVLKKQYAKLGSISWSEITVSTILALTILLWFFRDPGFMPGWSIIFGDGYVSDGTVAITTASLLFILPSKRPTFLGKRPEDPRDIKPVPPVLNWPTLQRMFPWDIVFLLGGGFALAEGATRSGFSDWLGSQLALLSGMPDWAICLVISIIACLLTECISNVVVTSLFVPIVAEVAQVTQIHPLYLLLPMAGATSLAFMLPAATAPNAIAFSYGHIRVIDLVKAGWMLNVLGISILMLFVNTYAIALFRVDEFPDWAAENYTAPTPAAPDLFL